jgi:hypothetical protein
MIKKHDLTLNTIKATFDELKQSVDSVRNISSPNSIQECDDLRKFDSIITKLKERWEKANAAYLQRRSNLKKALQAYQEYIKKVNDTTTHSIPSLPTNSTSDVPTTSVIKFKQTEQKTATPENTQNLKVCLIVILMFYVYIY